MIEDARGVLFCTRGDGDAELEKSEQWDGRFDLPLSLSLWLPARSSRGDRLGG